MICLSNEDDPNRNNSLKNHINNFCVHKKSIWNLEGHHSFQNIIGHFDWNPNFGSTSQEHNSFIFYDFEVRLNELEILLCLLKIICWEKLQNLKINTCDNAKHYRSLWTKCIERKKSPTSTSILIVLKRSIMSWNGRWPSKLQINFWWTWKLFILYLRTFFLLGSSPFDQHIKS